MVAVVEEMVDLDPIHFPPNIGDDPQQDDNDASYCSTFVEACHFAADTLRPLHLSQNIKDLPDVIRLRQRQQLTIRGTFSSKVKIAGKLHSLFFLNNSSQLILENLDLLHETPNEEDCRQVGAAINLRSKSAVNIQNCTIVSLSGFCCWAVQKACIHVESSLLQAPLRSALVCFGQAQLVATSCTIIGAGVHGICARGECEIKVKDSRVVNSAVRGLYAYANASIVLDGTVITGTMRSDMAAVEVSGSDSGKGTGRDNGGGGGDTGKRTSKKTLQLKDDIEKSSSLIMSHCCVTNNAGVGVLLRGTVRHNKLEDAVNENLFDGNQGGNVVEEYYAENKNTVHHDIETGGNPQRIKSVTPRRDESGSSFRKGDWWCPQCHDPRQIVPCSKDSCPRCQVEKGRGTILTKEEVIGLNRGSASNSTSAVANVDLAQNRHPLGSPEDGSTTWWFDGDDGVWLPYDVDSCQKLEKVFQSLCAVSKRKEHIPSNSLVQQPSPIVRLSGGRYEVNVQKMEQINTDTHFLRLVRRKGI